MFQSSKIAELQARIAELEGLHKKSEADHQAAVALVGDLQAQAAQTKLDHEKALVDLRAEMTKAADERVQREIVDALASAGVPESKLPARSNAEKPDFKAATEHYNTLTDAKERADYYASNVAPFFGKN